MEKSSSSASAMGLISESTDATVSQLGRKRARSSPSSDTSSQKRAMSEDPNHQALGEPQSSSRATEIDLELTCMREQPTCEAGSSEQPIDESSATLSPLERYDLIKSLQNSPMAIGETWYIVSREWYCKWERACRGEHGKDDIVSENQVGPVDNSMFFDEAGFWDRSKTLIEGEDVEFIPDKAWNLLTEWYGETPYELPRKVIGRGIKKEPTLELRPPHLRVYQLTYAPRVDNSNLAPKYISISSQADLLELSTELLRAFDLPPNTASSMWRIPITGIDGPYISYLKLPAEGEEFFWSSEKALTPIKTVEQLMLADNEGLALDLTDETGKPHYSALPSREPSSTYGEQVFDSGSGFFSKSFSSSTKLRGNDINAPLTNKQALLPYKADNIGRKVHVVPGTIGFSNMGNTCFMNSALQCLAHTPELVEYFLTGVYEDELNPDNPLGMQGAIAEAFGALLYRIWKPTSSAAYAPREFKMHLQRFAPQFSGYQQHDSQELVAFLLDGLHEDLNRVLKKPYIEKQDWMGESDLDLVTFANKSWEDYKRRNDSVIVDLFQGQYRSTLICPECEKVSITFDPYMYLTLPLPIQKKWSHNIYYIPWDTNKSHAKVHVEVNRNSTFKEVRQILGQWMEADPDHLLLLETFNNRFYKDLDDSVLVGDMSDHDMIVCYELPCPSRKSHSTPLDGDSTNKLILPVHLCKERSRGSFSRTPHGFAPPFIIVLDDEQVRSSDAIYAAIVERLERWTQNARDLYQWEMDETDTVVVHGVSEVAEISETGSVVLVNEPIPEEGDIVDEKAAVISEEGFSDLTPVLRRIGPKPWLFTINVQAGNCRFGTGAAFNNRVWEKLETRSEDTDDAEETSALLRDGDSLFCDWDDNFRSYFFGEDDRYELSCWTEKSWDSFIHPDLRDALAANAARINKTINLQDCLAEFTKAEKLGEEDLWYCPRCKKHQQATKRFEIWTIPDFLVVHLKRFSNSRILRDKIDAFVDFPVEGLDLESFCGEREVAKRLNSQQADHDLSSLSDASEPLIYDLYAVDEHIGGLGGGHYRAYAKLAETGDWYHFDDSFVTKVDPSDAVNANAYLLFYKKRSAFPLGGKTHEKVEAAKRKGEFLGDDDLSIPQGSSGSPTYDSLYGGKESSRETPAAEKTNEGRRGYFAQYGEKEVSQEGWRSMNSTPRISLSPSPPAVDESKSEFFSDDEVENRPPYDQLPEDSDNFPAHPLDLFDPSSLSNSPASSNAAEAGDDFDDTDIPLTP